MKCGIRMKQMVQRGGVSTKIRYSKLQEELWNELDEMDREFIEFHDIDIQQLALLKASQLGLTDFKVFFF